MKYSHLVLMISNTYCRFDANGLQILNSSLSVCNSLGDDGQADFEGDGFFVKPNDGVLVRGTNKGNIYEVVINPKVNQIFDIYSKTIGNPPPTHYLSFDTEKAELYVNGKILAQSLYLGEIDNGNIIDYVNDIGKKAIGGEYIDAKGIKVKKGNTVTFQVDEDGNVTARNAHFNGSVFVNGEIEGSIIKGAKIFAGDDYTEQDIIDALPGTIKGVTIEGSTIQSNTTINVTTNLSVGENIYLHPTSDDFYNNGGIYFESKAPYTGIAGKIAIVYRTDADFDGSVTKKPYFTLCSPNGGNIEITTGADKWSVENGDLLLRGHNVRLGVPAGSDGQVLINNSEALTDSRFESKYMPLITTSIQKLESEIETLRQEIRDLKKPQQ